VDGEAFVLDPYGATSPAEFFAVATEAFFEAPWQLATAEPAVFSSMCEFYRMDPRVWFKDVSESSCC
jgi:Mlc titration factor MtfA (ptsG expression regulator)